MFTGASGEKMSFNPAGFDDMFGVLPRLAEETELQKMLADEKIRSDQHRTNYQTIKAEHTRLQDEYVSLQEELQSTIEESKLVQEKYQKLLEQARQELYEKNSIIEDLKRQVPSEQQKNLTRLELREEVEMPYRAKVTALNEEIDDYRTELNKLKYQYAFLKSEYEHERSENARVIEELKMRTEAEVINLRKEKDSMAEKLQDDPLQDGQRIRNLQRENAQLSLKLRGVMGELEEIRAQKEHTGLQSDNISRMQSKQLAEHQANIKALQTEKESLRKQYDNIQRELTTAVELNTELTGKVHQLEKDNSVMKNRVEEVTHKSKVDVTDLKMQMLKERGELDRQKDRFANEVEDLKSQIEVLQYQLDQQSSALIEKEREANKRVQAAREEEWKKMHAVESEKLDLESRIQEMERLHIDEDTKLQADRNKFEELLKRAEEAREAAEKEAITYKTKLEHQDSLNRQVDEERTENSNLKMELHRLQTAYSSFINNENELLDANSRLQKQVEGLREENHLMRQEVSRSREEMDRLLLEQRVQLSEEKMNLQARLDALEHQLENSQIQSVTSANAYKKKIKKYARLIQKLRDRYQLTSARNEELKLEVDTLRKSVPPEAHLKLKKQMNDLLRRHREFGAVLTMADTTMVPGNLSLNANQSTPATGLEFIKNDLCRKNLEELHERVTALDENQKVQLEEMQSAERPGIYGDEEMSDLSEDELTFDDEINRDAKDEERPEKDVEF